MAGLGTLLEKTRIKDEARQGGGKIRYRGKIKNFLTLLKFGEYLHVGKAIAFGNGKYRITGENSP